jgi:E3 ubiquitin-protein ligase DOA10
VTGALKGQTECAICYSIVSSDKKMPDKRCQTCKHLFHSSCLFKWFASSNQSTCPLCRNPFNYGSDSDRRARRRGGPEE